MSYIELSPSTGSAVTPSDSNPLINGTAAPGTSALYSRGDHVHPSDTGRVAKAGDTMSGDLTISKANAAITLNKAASAQASTVYGTKTATARWQMALGDTSAESSGDAGSNLAIYRHNDAGTINATPVMYTLRSTGSTQFGGDIGIGMMPTVGTIPGFGNTTIATLMSGSYFAASNSNSAAYFANANIDTWVHVMNRSGVTVGSINVTATATTYATSSDANLKEDLREFDAGRIVDQTNVYDFAWKSTGERSYGVLAQQAKEIYPAAVFHNEEEDWWGVDYAKYVPVLLKK